MKKTGNIEANIQPRDNALVDNFLGLPATEMYHLLYDTLGIKSPLA